MIEFKSHPSEEVANVLVVEISGKLDTDSAESFFEQLESVVDQGHVNIVFDCYGLTYISSLGFGMMIRSHSRVQREGGVVRFARLQGVIEEAFKVVGFHKLFDNYQTVNDAVCSIAQAA